MDESTIHILLVEDEKAHAELVRLAFERHAGRFYLTVVGNLEQARAYLAESLPNLVIADWFLPDGRGTDLHADKIIALEDGRIVEVGDHRELLARGGLYSQMYRRQYDLVAASD